MSVAEAYQHMTPHGDVSIRCCGSVPSSDFAQCCKLTGAAAVLKAAHEIVNAISEDTAGTWLNGPSKAGDSVGFKTTVTSVQE